MSISLVIVGIVLCLVCSAFFSAAEMSYSSCNALRLENLAEENGKESKKAKTALYITQNFDNALSAILIGNNLANIAGSSLASVLVMLIAGSDNYTWIATVGMTILVIIFGETVPKITAKKNANRYALGFSYALRALMIILYPLVRLVVTLVRLLSAPFKGRERENAREEAVDELQSIIETAEDEEVLDVERSELVRSAIDFHEVSASEIMTARVDVIALDIDDDRSELLRQIEESSYSRLPVYEGSIDNIIGILYLNRFLKTLTEDPDADIRPLLMPPVFVYKTMKLPDVLAGLRREKQHLAIVTDEYGGMLGVVSMEDVLEQIVGEIWDEEDTVEQEVVRHPGGELELDGDMAMSDFIELAEIRENDFDCESDTLGGWTTEMFGKFPAPGDSFTCGFEPNPRGDLNVSPAPEYFCVSAVTKPFTLTVLSMDGRRIEKVLVKFNDD